MSPPNSNVTRCVFNSHGHSAATHLRRNNSLTKEEKHELNLRKREQMIQATDTCSGVQHAALHDEKENEDNRLVGNTFILLKM